jgi:beta-lactam-binding protein with PASTA domain
MFKFVTKRPLWFNILVGIGLMAAIFFVFMLSLNWITHHGIAKTVPSVTGKKLSDATTFLEDKGFDVLVQDSVYYDSLPPAVIIRQVPEADAVVKVNRTVYVTVNRSVPPEVDMPNLIGYSYRNAEMVLSNMGLRIGDTTYKADFAKNSILEQLYNGQNIRPGTKIRMGSAVSLVIGNGIGNEDIAVPKLVGLTFSEAKILLDANGLILGSAVPDPMVKDEDNAYVYKQSPDIKDPQGRRYRIRPGQMIDVWLSVEKPVTDSTTTEPPAANEPDKTNSY